MKKLLFTLSLLLWQISSFAQYSIEVGSVEYLELEPPAGYVRSANWHCDEGLKFTDKSEVGAIVMVDHYFSGAAYVTCSYVYEYLGSYDGNYHAGTGSATFRITCIGETVNISETNLTLDPGQTHKLTFVRSNSHGTPTWTSSNEDVATVDDNGKVTAVASGVATITLDPIVGPPCFCSVRVSQIDPTGVTLEPESMSLLAGEKGRFTCKFSPSGASDDVTWSSSDENIASVSSTGMVTAVGEGTARITATTDGGLTASGMVEVMPKPEQVSLPASQDIAIGYRFKLTPVLTPANAVTTYTWETDAPAIATVDAEGKVRGLKKGTATITVSTANGKTASCKVTVKDAPEGMDFLNAEQKVDILLNLAKDAWDNLSK